MAAALACFLLPILLGVSICALGGAPTSYLVVQLSAAAIGVGVIWALALRPLADKAVCLISSVATVALLMTLFSTGIDGVNRWVPLGPLQLCVSSMVAPVLLLASCRLLAFERDLQAVGLISLALLISVSQPDAAATMGFGACALILSVQVRRGGVFGVLFAGVAVLCTGVAWWLGDPLLPAAFVEDMVSRALAMSTVVGVIAIASLCLPIAFVVGRTLRLEPNPAAHLFGWCLTAYLFAMIVSVGLGNFPTPLLGYGASPVIGTAIGFGLLLGSGNTQPLEAKLDVPASNWESSDL